MIPPLFIELTEAREDAAMPWIWEVTDVDALLIANGRAENYVDACVAARREHKKASAEIAAREKANP